MIDEGKFVNWLVQNKKFGAKSAKDVKSRCHRVERIFNISLDEELIKPHGLEYINNRLIEEQQDYLKPETNVVYATAVLKRAVTLYAEYLDFK